MIKELESILKKSESLPFLFVGSGFSKRYLNTPDWKNLLKEVALRINDNPYYFGKLESLASKKFDELTEYNSYMTLLCDLISDDLDQLWFTDDKFKVNRDKYGELVLAKKIEPIKVEITEIINSKSMFPNEYVQEIDDLKEITYKSVAGLITTNYDTLLEDIFGFETYNSQDDLLFSQNLEVGEIYKIHGSIKDPSSIMINTKDYQSIEKKNKYVAAKLMTIFIEHPVIFMGYSISDEDIRNILKSITNCLEESQKLELQRRLIFIEWDDSVNEVKESTIDITFSTSESITLTKFIVKDFSEVFKTIGLNKSDLPVKTLRRLKQSMYDLTLSSKSNERVYVQKPDKIINDNDFEIIAGFGLMELAKRGYGSIDPFEIYRDVVMDDSNFNTELLVEDTLPDALLKKSGYLPYRKYLVEYEKEIPERIKKNMKRFNNKKKLLPQAIIDNNNYLEIEFHDAMKMSNLYEALALVDYDLNENVKHLEKFLMDEINKSAEIIESSNSFRRLIRIFDFSKYS